MTIALALAVGGLMIQSGHIPSTRAAPSEHVCAGPSPCFHHIQDAIDAATTNTIIMIDPGTYLENLSVPGLGSATTLTLWANPSATVDGDHLGTVLTVASGVTVTLRYLNLIHGRTSQGSGIYNQGTLTLLNSAVHDNGGNISNEGGGIFNDGGSLTLQGTTSVHDNFTRADSAGIGNFGGAVLLEDASSIDHNSAGIDGGGVFDDESGTPNTVPAPGPGVTLNTPDKIS
jgi:hypothetical protein